jgi:O-antigen/teichoic acid export membrane protein
MIAQALRRVLDRQTFPGRLAGSPHQVRSIAYLIAGNGLRIGLGLLTSTLVYRTLGPANMGRLTLTLGVVGLFAIVAEFGLRDAALNDIARYLATLPERAFAVARTALAFKALLATVASVIPLALAGVIAARFYPAADIAGLIRLGALSLLPEGLLGYYLVILEANAASARSVY